jgi:predicted nucleotidyltransferase
MSFFGFIRRAATPPTNNNPAMDAARERRMASCREGRGGCSSRGSETAPRKSAPSLPPQRETLARCLEAMNRALPLREVWLFGSHARGEARPDSDVDLCLVAEGAERQLAAAQTLRRAMWEIEDKPAFTLVPIAPQRLAEKKAIDDHFFGSVLQEGILLPAEN